MSLNHPPPPAPEAPAEDARPRVGRAADVHAVLLEEIETGRLPPGAPLDERALAARFSVSRTPVREALQQLAVRGWVRIAPRQGITVARLSVSRLRAILEFIAEAEAMVARLAARRVDDDLKRQLDAALERGQQA
ncbi:MAG: GntR family transcriptional regulator, partial [Acidobacteria bacterium]|nr:GntR family transcriptional regulator [Acidobacteriota bacterium]